ncbi:MAG TPA: NAD(P)/FAD-dependent oxidoreductase [Oscillospiraceae bacterium]|nr:NAD(P)/FAD-dependent oxidoreductase [Oscillospiraceae bacterium]
MKKVNIIGAGLAGLSAGIYLQQSGVETEIFELAGWAGGMCTTWVRNNYRFDGCIHWMVGTKPGDEFYKLYREVDALAEDTVIYNAEFIQLEIGGVMYEMPMQIAKLKDFLHSLSPQDSEKIEGFCSTVETLMNSKMPSGAPSNPLGLLKMLKESGGFLSVAKSYLNVTVEDYAKTFQSPALRSLLFYLMPKDFSAVALFMMLGTRMSGNAGYPMGGALDVIKRMQAKYTSVGGKIHFNSKVDEIVVENGKATAIRSKNVLYPANAVIAACDAYDTLKNMLGGKYQHPTLSKMLESSPVFHPLAVVSFGLNKKFGIPYSVTYECPQGIQVSPDSIQHVISLRAYDFDPAAAPENCSSVMVMLNAPLDYWQNLRSTDLAEYKKQKEQLANSVADAIEKRIPGFQDAIQVTDVATPATYVHLTNVYKGSFEGFEPTPAALKTQISKKISGVKNLFLCGQWTTAGGGICSAVSSGKEAARLVSKKL